MFNLREFQTESQYNEVKNNMPKPNVVHIVSPDTVLFNPKTARYWWEPNITYGYHKVRGLMFYDNTVTEDTPYYGEVKIDVYLKDGTVHETGISLGYERPYTMRFSVENIRITHTTIINKQSLWNYEESIGTYNNKTKWYTVDLTRLFQWLELSGLGWINRWHPNPTDAKSLEVDYFKVKSIGRATVKDHYKVLIKDTDYENGYTPSQNAIEYIPD